MVALSVGIIQMSAAHTQDLVDNGVFGQCGAAEFIPIPPLSACNHIIDRCDRELFMIEVPMLHTCTVSERGPGEKGNPMEQGWCGPLGGEGTDQNSEELRLAHRRRRLS